MSHFYKINKELQQKCDSFFYDLNLDCFYKSSLLRLLSASDFALTQFKNHPDFFSDLILENNLTKPRKESEHVINLTNISESNEINYISSLRLYRNKEMCRIAWRAIGMSIKVETILKELSILAAQCLLNSLKFATNLISYKYKVPLTKTGEKQQLYIVSLGKLGGQELNFSSDVDIYFVYDEETPPSEQSEIAASTFFTKVAKKIVFLLSESTKDGFVYRVDLRLRPSGQSGPLVISLKSLEIYYQEQGRDWERYAMVKARVLNKVTVHSLKLVKILSSFVYRRYIDFSIMEALRSLKAIIEREVQVKHLQYDIKRGPGGIREIEFICQSHQLIRGGREHRLRSSSTFKMFIELDKLGILDLKKTQQLRAAYIYYRELENSIQMLNDKQCHQLPEQDILKNKMLIALKIESWQKLEQMLKKHRNNISNIFEEMLNVKEHGYQNKQRTLETQLLNLCRNKLGDVPSEDLLLSIGFIKPLEALSLIDKLFSSGRFEKLSQLSKVRLKKFLPVLLIYLQSNDVIDEVFFRIIVLLEKVIKRSTYLALLIENPIALQHLISLFSLSPWISRYITNTPFLLQVLLDEPCLIKASTKTLLEKKLTDKLEQVNELEDVVESLKQFKLTEQLKVAASYVNGNLTAGEASKHLSLTALLIIKWVLKVAKIEILKKHPDCKSILQSFAIIAYGKLGSGELNINSDLDLVFLHNASLEEVIFINRLSRKILHILNTRTMSGVLYTVDTRLRPSGSAGLLVSHIDAFSDYQINKAWTWEHQALCKARTIAGSNIIEKKFSEVRKTVLSKKYDLNILAEDISNMRKKMKQQKPINNLDKIKQQDLGLVDVEFLMQSIVLSFSFNNPKLLQCLSVIEIIDTCCETKVLEANIASQIKIYCFELNEQIFKITLLSKSKVKTLIKPPECLKALMVKYNLIFI